MRLRTIVLTAALLLSALAAEAQISTGNIIGVVRDESRAVLPGVTVTITSPAMPGGPATSVTNTQGEYRFTELAPGTYALSVTLTGFNTYKEEDLRVLVGGTTERAVTLQVGAVTENITVSGQSPVVDTRKAGITNSLAAEQLEAAAFERYGVQGYLAMLPGVTTGNYNRVFNVTVMGSNSNETTILTDGVSINNVRTGGSWLLSDFDGAQEVSTTTLGASAEYQAAGGGILNVVGKTGTNAFHGDAAGFWSPDALTSKPVKMPCPKCPEGESGFTWYKYRDWSAHLGGPIKRDRLWFFTGLIYRGRFGTPPGQPEPPAEEQFLDMITDTNTKVTWKINDKLMFQQTYYGEIWGTVNPNIVSPTRPIATLQHSEAGIKDDPNPGSQLTWIMSPSTVLTTRYGLTMGASERIGFFRDLTTPNRTDAASQVQSGNTNAHRFWPRRDEVSAKLNTYLSGDRLNHNLSFGVQISRNKDVFVQIEPGGVLYSDLPATPELATATFVGPDARGAVSKAQGVWAENDMTMGRVTVKVGGRFDRMVGISQDVPQFDGEFNEIGTLQGLGEMVTWNTFSPRVGGNVRLTNDSKTVLRAVAGRYYLPLYLGEFEDLHPGRAVRDLYRFNPNTGGYTTFVSRTDPRAQVRFDPNAKAPYTDQYSIGVDREIAANLGIGVNFVRKNGGNQLGWVDTGGVYGTREMVINGQNITVFPLLNLPSARSFLRTNGPDYYTRYTALILTATRRLANRWQFTAGYTRQKAEGLEPGTGSAAPGANRSNTPEGRDPNDLINLDGRLGARDRPNMVSLMGSYEIPKIEVQVSGNLTAVSGTAISSQANVSLPQGTRAINLEAPGSTFRTPEEKFMHIRFTKMMFRNGPRRLELTGEVKNALNEMGTPSIRSQIYNNANFLVTNTYPEPRQLRLFARFFF
jgi:Carboxypeptidase regulatory-like domain